MKNLCYTYKNMIRLLKTKGCDETMVNEKRVKQMSKLAIYEQKMGKEPFRLSSYYRSDYVRLQGLKTLVAITIAYGICLAGYMVLRLEYILDHLMQIDYKNVGIIIVGSYLLLLVVFFLLSRVLAVRKYERAKAQLEIYSHLLGELEQSYKEEQDPMEDKKKEGRQ